MLETKEPGGRFGISLTSHPAPRFRPSFSFTLSTADKWNELNELQSGVTSLVQYELPLSGLQHRATC
jgi:hypothetical protein